MSVGVHGTGGGKIIRDATAVPQDVKQGQIFYNNDGRQVGINDSESLIDNRMIEILDDDYVKLQTIPKYYGNLISMDFFGLPNTSHGISNLSGYTGFIQFSTPFSKIILSREGMTQPLVFNCQTDYYSIRNAAYYNFLNSNPYDTYGDTISFFACKEDKRFYWYSNGRKKQANRIFNLKVYQ